MIRRFQIEGEKQSQDVNLYKSNVECLEYLLQRGQ